MTKRKFDFDRALKEYLSGKTFVEVGKMFGISDRTAQEAIKRTKEGHIENQKRKAFKQIPDTPLVINKYGIVKDSDGNIVNKTLDPNGRHRVSFQESPGRQKHVAVGKNVLLLFGPKPKTHRHTVVRYKDNNITNNNIKNLCWETKSDGILRTLKRLAENGLCQKDIAREIGISKDMVRHHCNRNGIILQSGKYQAPRDRMIELTKQGLTQKQIAKALKCSSQTVGETLMRAGISRKDFVEGGKLFDPFKNMSQFRNEEADFVPLLPTPRGIN